MKLPLERVTFASPAEFVIAVPKSGVILPVKFVVKVTSCSLSATPSFFKIAVTVPKLSVVTGFVSEYLAPFSSTIFTVRVVDPLTPVSSPCPPLD